MEKLVDKIRSVGTRYIDIARREGRSEVTIQAGDVVRELSLVNRTPNVCMGLTSSRFLIENHIELVNSEGPPSGQSTTMKYTYRLRQPESPTPGKPSGLLALRGSGKAAYKQLGGGEAFLKSERAAFDRS